MANKLHIDFEIFSASPLPEVGAYRYAHDPSTEILCCAVAQEDAEPLLWVPAKWRHLLPEYAHHWGNAEYLIEYASENPDTITYAHNAQFEIAISHALWEKTFGFPAPQIKQWRCTATMARRAALPPSLGKLSEALDLKNKKDKAGDALIRIFCMPQKKDSKKYGVKAGERITPEMQPELFRQFCDYCLQDVRAEQEVAQVLKPFELQPGMVLDTFHMDAAINQRGLPVNLLALHNAQAIINEEVARIGAEFRQMTGLEPTQGKAFLEWLEARGYTGGNLQAATIDEQLEEMSDTDLTTWGHPDDLAPNPNAVISALRLRKQISYAAVKKVPAMLRCAGPHDNQVRGTLTVFGAGPGRWTASLVQPQNMKRPTIKHTEEAYRDIEAGVSADLLRLLYGNPLEVISSCIRHFIHDSQQFVASANEDEWTWIGEREMLDVDYAAIEARIVCWLAGQEDALQDYRDGVDRYVRMAMHIFNKPAELITKEERFIGKQCILGCGYGMGPPKFIITCAKFGVTVDLELAEAAVATYRLTHAKVKQLWWDTESAAKNAIQNPGTRYKAGRLEFFSANVASIKYLFLKLPSGRHIAYPHIQLDRDVGFADYEQEVKELPTLDANTRTFLYGSPTGVPEKPKGRPRDRISYWAKLDGKSIWGRVETYGGKLVENGDQGTAADIMMCGALNAERAGYQAATLIHDELLAYKQPGQTVEGLIAEMTRLPAWAAGLPVAAEGDVVPFYKK